MKKFPRHSKLFLSVYYSVESETWIVREDDFISSMEVFKMGRPPNLKSAKD